MSDKTIDEVTPDTNVTGVEKLPVSDGGTPKSMTVDQVKGFVISKIAEITGASDITLASDGVFIKSNGTLKPIDADKLADAIILFAFAKESPSSLSASDIVSVGVGGSAKSTTIGAIAAYIGGTITPTMNIAGLPDASALADADYAAVSQSVQGVNTSKKTTLSALKGFVLAGVGAAASESTAAIGASDQLLILSGGAFKKVTRANASFGSGNVTGPNTSLDGHIPLFDGTTGKVLKDGLSVATAITAAASDTEIPTAKAVSDAIGDTSDFVEGPSYITDISGKIAQFDGDTGRLIKGGFSVSNSMVTTSKGLTILTQNGVNDSINEMLYADEYESESDLPSSESNGRLAVVTDGNHNGNLYFKSGNGWYKLTGTLVQGE